MKVITTEQQEFLGKELLKIFCPNNMKPFSYVMNVLLPETVIYLIMEAYSVDYHQVESIV